MPSILDPIPVVDLDAAAAAGDFAAQVQLGLRLAREGELESAERWLRSAAGTGNADARAALGRHLLEHVPQEAREGLALLVGAAQESPEAAHLSAVFTAAGIGLSQSFSTALDLLQRAAELGHQLAGAELALLAGELDLSRTLLRPETRTGVDWANLRKACDAAALLALPPVEIASSSPRIAVVPGFASPAVCDWLIERARHRVQRAQIFDTGSGVLRLDEQRTNRETHFHLLDCDLVMMFTRARLAAITGAPLLGLELTAVLHYTEGQRYAPHVDYFDVTLPGYTEEVANNGQRALTFLVYLNDDYEGGQTEFPILDARFRGSKGDALFFWNIDPLGAIDPRTLHAGLPPVRGEKWLMSQWIRLPQAR